MAASVTDIRKVLDGVEYPATGGELAAHAERQAASPEVMDVLRHLEDGAYDGPDRVMDALRDRLGGTRDGDAAGPRDRDRGGTGG